VFGIAAVVKQFRQNWARELDEGAVRRAFRDVGHRWRERKLDPVTTVRLFFLQIVSGNTACNDVPRISKLNVTGSAYCEARKRLPLEALQVLLARCTGRMMESARDSGRWLGHRLFIVDGSSFSMPDTTELQEHFGQPGAQREGCGFPVAHWLALVHFGSGLLRKTLTSPLRTHDMARTTRLHPSLEANDVLLGDRAFCSFTHIALLAAQQVHVVLRIHQRILVNFRPRRKHTVPGRGRKSIAQKGLPRSRWIQKLGRQDQIVEWFKPVRCPAWLSEPEFAALPETLRVRELRYRISRPGYRTREVTLVTTLLNADVYTADELARAYRLRWAVETSFRHIKTTMQMDVLHCRTVDGVLKELTMFVLTYNLVRMTMLEAAKRQQVEPDRISFVDALRWLRNAQPGDELPKLKVNPTRPDRHEPRVRKRRPKSYPLMTQPRQRLKELLAAKNLAA
jgi:Transposase DDE domain